jgi:hypothetical protein
VEAPTLTLLTPTLTFATTLVGEQRSLDLRIRNQNQVTPVALQSMGTLPGDFQADFAPRTLIPGDTFHTVVTFEPGAPVVHDFQLEFTHDAGAPLRVRIIARCDTWIPEQITDFGNVPVVNGQTDWLDVDLPPDAISLSIEALAPTSSDWPGLLGLEGPGGKIYENDQATGAYLWTPGFSGVFTATIPNTDSANVQLVTGGGRYRFRLFMFSGSANFLAVRAIVENRASAVAPDGVLDLNVFLAPGLGVSSPSTETRLGAILTRMDNLFEQVGLSLGDIDYYQLGDSAYDSVSSSEFESLLAESRVASERRLNLFFVLTAFGGGTIGVAGTIAGPARNGTAVSGVMSDYDFDTPEAAGTVAAHEVGHYLGLFHTTEQNGDHDIIEDTLECPASGTDSVCTTLGNGYLMHWQYTGASVPAITDGQAHVILAHPLVAPPPALGGLTAYKLSWTSADVYITLPPGYCATCNSRYK